MLVDDEEIVHLELNRSVDWNSLGFSISIEANNGLEAITKLDQNPIDLVITDIKMPKVDGIELLKHLKENKLCSYIIFLSGYSDFKFAQQGLVLGAFDYILKPVEPSVLKNVLNRVKKQLDEKKAVDHNAFYYSDDKEANLKSYVALGDKKALSAAEELYDEIHLVLKDELYKTGLILNRIIVSIINDLTSNNTLLKKIMKENHMTGKELIDTDCLNDMRVCFVEKINEILIIVNAFNLNQKNNIINKVCEYVLKNIDSNLTLKSIAEQFYISKNYLSFLFKQETGENFLDYLTKVKMERAKVLLKEDNCKAYEASSLLGYSEATYFSKLFKKHTGFTPSEYKRNL